MPDITMCDPKKTNTPERTCPRATSCYRHTAKPTKGRQSYFGVLPMSPDGCDYFWLDQVAKR